MSFLFCALSGSFESYLITHKKDNMQVKKKRMSASISTENFAFLKWLNLNYQDTYSWVIDTLLTKYRETITAQMTDYEKQMIQNLKVVIDESIFDRKKIESVRIKAFDLAFENKLMEFISNDEKRGKLRELLDMEENK